MDVAVAENQLALAIGRGGQNVRLASELTGWTLNVMTEGEADEKSEAEAHALQRSFMDQLDVDEEVAAILVQEGFTTVDEVAYVPLEEMLKVEEFDGDIARELQSRALDVLLTRAMSSEAMASDLDETLLAVEGMTLELARLLASHGVATGDDLAEQSVDELVELVGMDPEEAGKLIMAARAAWFAEDQAAQES